MGPFQHWAVELFADIVNQPIQSLRHILRALAAWAAVVPNIPAALEALVGADLANLGAGDALILAIVPLPDVIGDLNRGRAGETLARVVAVGLPWQRAVWQTQIEELKGALSALAGRYVADCTVPRKTDEEREDTGRKPLDSVSR